MALMKQKIILAVCLSSLFLMPFAASARGLVPCGGYQDNGTPERVCNVEDAFVLVARVTNFLIAMAGVFAVFEFIRSGFWLIVSMGNEEDITKNKSAMQNAVIGFILVMMAFMFINTVANYMLSRVIVTDPKSPNYNANCKFDLTNPLTYLNIDPKKCSSVVGK